MKKYFILFAFIFQCYGNLDSLVEKIIELDRKAVVSIGGCPGVGKSTLADQLKEDLENIGLKVLVLNLDAFSQPDAYRKTLPGELDIRRMDWQRMHDVLSNIKQATSILKPVYNQLTRFRGEEVIDLEMIDCILFEGCYALGDFPPMDLVQYADLAVYLETSVDNIYDWKWDRELKKNKRRTDEEFYKHMVGIMEEFAKYVYPTKKNADVVIWMDSNHECHLMENNKVDKPDFSSFRQAI